MKSLSPMKRCFATFKARNTNIIKNHINTKEATVIDSFFFRLFICFLIFEVHNSRDYSKDSGEYK